MKDLRKEYAHRYYVYQKDKIKSQQYEYRKTEKGKIALKRARENQILKQLCKIRESPNCFKCGQSDVSVLVPVKKEILCYNCKYKRTILMECE